MGISSPPHSAHLVWTSFPQTDINPINSSYLSRWNVAKILKNSLDWCTNDPRLRNYAISICMAYHEFWTCKWSCIGVTAHYPPDLITCQFLACLNGCHQILSTLKLPRSWNPIMVYNNYVHSSHGKGGKRNIHRILCKDFTLYMCNIDFWTPGK